MKTIDLNAVKNPATKDILKEFLKITAIPHASGNCREICSYFCNWAEKHNLEYETDATGNIIVQIPATPGYEKAPVTVLQTHMDMVYVSDENADGIEPVICDGFLKSKHSSLGADDNIGTAIIMNIIKSGTIHGPLKWISTVDEETSMIGANKIDRKHFRNVQYMINIDSENYDRVCVSSAGGCNIELNKKPVTQICKKDYAIKIAVSGLKGGHSGMNIQYNRLNGIIAIREILTKLMDKGLDFDIISAKSGSASNAIPLYSEISLAVTAKNKDKIKKVIIELKDELSLRFRNIEDNINFDISEQIIPQRILSADDTASIMNLLSEIPNGVIEYSKDIEDFVETSSNIGIMNIDEKSVEFRILSRSSNTDSLEKLINNICNISAKYRFRVKKERNANPWELKADNELIPMILNAFNKITGEEMVTEAIHAGLETGAFSAKNPKMNIASIGPDVFEPHSLNERCRIDSIPITRNIIVRVLKEIAK